MSAERHTINRLASSRMRRHAGKQAAGWASQWKKQDAPKAFMPGRAPGDAGRIKEREDYEAMPEGFTRGIGGKKR